MSYPWHKDAHGAFEAYARAGRVPHAVLIAGPSGCGNAELAMDIARQLLCLKDAPGGCGECRSCNQLRGGAHPDFREITFEINPKNDKLRDVIIVDQVRALIEAMYKTTTTSARKVAVVHPAEAMNRSAANALLKTLEEPVGDTVLILVCHDVGRLPATVRSRCQRLNVALPVREEALAWLIENSSADRKIADMALVAAAGRPLEAATLLESGAIEHFGAAIRLLHLLRSGATSDGKAVAAMTDFDASSLWTWLSLCCAEHIRRSHAQNVPAEDLRPLAELQLLADRNRLLVATPVRKDLLLRDWLIQWKNLPATLPLERQMQEA